MNTSKQVQSETQRFEQLLNMQGQLDDAILEDSEFSDMLVEKLLDSMKTSPLGRLLSVISTLPEVRTEKVERARRQIHQPEECWDVKMDLALDRVLEELIFDE